MIRPVIKLETLSSLKTRQLLYTSWFIVLGAAILAGFEPRLTTNELNAPSSRCVISHISSSSTAVFDPTRTPANDRMGLVHLHHAFGLGANSTGCTMVSGNQSVWHGTVSLKPEELYFAVFMSVASRNAWVPHSLDLEVGIELFSSSGKVILSRPLNATLKCSDTSCKDIGLVSEWDYMFTQSEVFSSYHVALTFNNLDLLTLGDVRFTFAYHSALYRRVSAGLRVTGCVVTLVVIWLYMRTLWRQGYQQTLREQVWIATLVCLLLLYQDPFYLPLIEHQVETLWILSGCVVYTAKAGMLVFWLLVMHGISGDQKDWYKFYLPKWAFGLVFLGASVAFVLFRPYSSFEDRSLAWLIAFIVLIISAMYWLAAMFQYSRSAHQKLQQMPYVTTRFRQLSYRFFLLQTALVILFLITSNIVMLVMVPVSQGQYWDGIAQFVVVTVYVYIVAYVYAPAYFRKGTRPAPAPAAPSEHYKLLSEESVNAAVAQMQSQGSLPPSNVSQSASLVGSAPREFSFDYQDDVPELDWDRGMDLESDLVGPGSVDFGGALRAAQAEADVIRMDRAARRKARDLARQGKDPTPQAGETHERKPTHVETAPTTPSPRPPPMRPHADSAASIGAEQEDWFGAFPQATTDFSLHTATWLLYFANQAYYDLPGQAPTACTAGTLDIPSHFGFHTVKTVSTDKDIYVLISRKEHIVVVSFRGTASMKNVQADLAMTRVKMGENEDPTESSASAPQGRKSARAREIEEKQRIRSPNRSLPRTRRAQKPRNFSAEYFSKTVKIHSGFWRSYASVRSEVVSTLLKLRHDQLRQPHAPPLTVYCTGHSLGGALATLCAFTLSTRLRMNVQMYNYGCPRVGDSNFAREYNVAVPCSYRVVCDRDIVTTIPKFCCLFKHVGNEILVDSRGNWIVNPSFVEKILRERRSKLKDHLLGSYLVALKRACVVEQALLPYLSMANPQMSAPRIDLQDSLGDGSTRVRVEDVSVSIPTQLDKSFW